MCEFGGGGGQREHKHTVYNTTSYHFSSGLALELRRGKLFEEARLWVGGREERRGREREEGENPVERL